MTLTNHVAKLVAKFWNMAFHRPFSPIGPERVIGGDVKEVMIKLESALSWHDIGCGSWLTWKGSGPGAKSGTISFKFRPQSLSDRPVITATLPLSLHFIINQSKSVTNLSWAYELDDPTFQDDKTVIEITEKIIESLLAQV